MFTVKVVMRDKTVLLQANEGENLHKLLAREGIPIDAACGGHGTCGKCRVKLIEGQLHSPSALEKTKLGELIYEGVRMACLQRVFSDLTIEPIVSEGEAQIMTGGNFNIEHTDGEEGYGLAVDIGTTTVAAFLMDLKYGAVAATRSALNAQKPYGADVIARCSYALEREGGARELRELICAQISDMALQLCSAANTTPDKIIRATLAGNPTMMHLAAGLNVGGIAVAPYSPAYHASFELNPKDAMLPLAPDGAVHFLPVISGYVGADTVAAVMASELDEGEAMSLMIDIGTNGEIVLGNKHRMIGCAAAAGPAFEGGKITFGMGGLDGAIDSFSDDGGPRITTIGNGKAAAKGICGSGLIDIIAVLAQKGFIDETGVLSSDFCDDPSFVERFDEDDNFVLARESEGAARDIYLTQKDVREVQLAKSAIAAGIEILALRMGISLDEIEIVFLAGGFGSYIDYDSACAIGLLPIKLRNKIVAIGNAAGTGARITVCSAAQRERADSLSRRIEYVELAEAHEFADLFMENMMFPEN